MHDLPAKRLDPRIIDVWRISEALSSLVGAGILIGTCAALWANDVMDTLWFIGVVAIVVLLAAIDVAFVPRIRYIRWRYEVTEEEVDLLKGIIVHKHTVIPLVRVQHVDTKQGPIARAFGLAAVTVGTAAGEHEIPGLPVEEADNLRDRVATLAAQAREDS
jgi:membrane protein YdbS with pleckstrin-like domain